MIPKPKRIVNKKLLKEMRLPYCELCGNSFNTEVHHIVSRAAGGDDVRENLVCLCFRCHTIAHYGGITKERLREIVARRERP